MCSLTRPLNESEAGVDLALIQTSLFSLCKSVVMLTSCSEVCIKARSTPASFSFKGLATEHRTVKSSIILDEIVIVSGFPRGMMMTACDLNGTTKPWEIQKEVSETV